MKKVRPLVIACVLVAAAAPAMLVREKFTTDPALDGCCIFGNTNLFQWNQTNHALAVTWDSTQTNSYFYRPLGRTFTKTDSFCVLFDLQLDDALAYNSGMELAIGLLHLSDATSAAFSRAFFTSPNLYEFDYFPSFVYSGQRYADSVEASFIDASVNLFFASEEMTLQPGMTYRITLVHPAGAGTVHCQICTNGQLVCSLPGIYGGVGDFQLDTLAVMNYSDDGFGDSILAHGSVRNLAFASPLPVDQIRTDAAGKIQFASDTNWLYTLEQSADSQIWAAAAPAVFGNGTNLTLQATNLPAETIFYRVRAELP